MYQEEYWLPRYRASKTRNVSPVSAADLVYGHEQVIHCYASVFLSESEITIVAEL